MTLQEARTMISTRLREAGIEAFEYETWVLMEWKLGVSRADFYMDPGREIPEQDLASLEEVLARRSQREPLQYLMGHCDFMGYDFFVDERVLVPRMDTECLVEEAAMWLRARQLSRKKLRILDMCTGSGCIGISLKLLFPQAEVVLSDLSEGALLVAKRNSEKLEADVRILQGDLYDALTHLPEEERVFDLIISNPPYIPSQVVEGLMPEVKDFEPLMALDGREDGLEFYRRISEGAPKYLAPQGAVYYEIGAEQGQDVSDLLKSNHFQNVLVIKDLAGLDRIVRGNLS